MAQKYSFPKYQPVFNTASVKRQVNCAEYMLYLSQFNIRGDERIHQRVVCITSTAFRSPQHFPNNI